MVTFKQYLSELFNSAYRWKDLYGRGDAYLFKTEKGDEVFVDFMDYGPKHFNVEFNVNGKSHITGTGDAYKIFSTVIDIIKDHLSKNDTEEIKFTADKISDSASRTKLYTTMVNKLASRHGFSVRVYNTSYQTGFLLMKRGR